MKTLLTMMRTLTVATLALATSRAFAVNGEWITAASSATPYDWTNANNWASGNVAGGAGFTADIALEITNASTLTVLLRQNVTVGTLQLGDTGSGTDRPTSIQNYLDYTSVYETYRLTFDGNGSDAALIAVGTANKTLRGVTLNSRTVMNNEGGTIYFYAIQIAGASGSTTDSHYNRDGINGTGSLVLQAGLAWFQGREQWAVPYTYSGGFTLEGGTAKTSAGSSGANGAPTSGPFGTGRLTLAGGTLESGQSNGIGLHNKVTLSANTTINSSVFYFNVGNSTDAFVLDTANPVLTDNRDDSGRTTDFNGVISPSTSYPLAGLTLAGNTDVNTRFRFIGNANTYVGATTLRRGRLELAKTAGTTSIAGNLLIGGTTGKATVRLDNNNQIVDAATVSLNANGRLSLNNKSETIGALELTTGALVETAISGALTTTTLTIDGKLKPAGTYTAANLSAFITGTGSVVALTGQPLPSLITIQ